MSYITMYFSANMFLDYTYNLHTHCLTIRTNKNTDKNSTQNVSDHPPAVQQIKNHQEHQVVGGSKQFR